MNLLLRRFFRWAMRQAWRRGVTSGSRTWTLAGGAALLGWLATKTLHREAEVVFSEKLAPGESIRVFHEPQT